VRRKPHRQVHVRDTFVKNSGKLLILGIVAVAVLMAGASWWFRYRATHRAAEFWGPAVARLIRDAPEVRLVDLRGGDAPAAVDISKAPGMIHLRYALLEDRSYKWPDPSISLRLGISSPRWSLTFADPDVGEEIAIRFPANCELAKLAGDETNGWAISCSPIAIGLQQVFAEYSSATTNGVR
jgi:hypothetical protein